MKLLIVFLLTCACTIAFASPSNISVGATNASTHAVELKPVLGWSSWSFIRNHPSATKIEAQAQALHDSGLQELGYKYINLDDFWYVCKKGGLGPAVDKYGLWVARSSEFPSKNGINGIKLVANYVHSLGLKFGIYVTPGISKRALMAHSKIEGTPYTVNDIAEPRIKATNYNCGGMVDINFNKPAAQRYIDSWADRFASWGIDFVKLDGVGNGDVGEIKAWAKAIKQSGRPMVLDVTEGTFTTAIAPVLTHYANQWEMAPDIECYSCQKRGQVYPLTKWSHVRKRFQLVSEWQPYAHPGHYNDYDSIEVGNGANDGLTPAERKTQLSLWALASAPMILGTDLTHLDPLDLSYLKNKAVLAIDQDGIAANMVVDSHGNGRRVFAKTLANGTVVIGLFNLNDSPQVVSVLASVAGLPTSEHGYALRNLWNGDQSRVLGPYIRASVPAHGVVLYKARPSDILIRPDAQP